MLKINEVKNALTDEELKLVLGGSSNYKKWTCYESLVCDNHKIAKCYGLSECGLVMYQNRPIGVVCDKTEYLC